MIFSVLSPVRAAWPLRGFDFVFDFDLTRSFYELDFVRQLPLPIQVFHRLLNFSSCFFFYSY
jgi:hypothetical protein